MNSSISDKDFYSLNKDVIVNFLKTKFGNVAVQKFYNGFLKSELQSSDKVAENVKLLCNIDCLSKIIAERDMSENNMQESVLKESKYIDSFQGMDSTVNIVRTALKLVQYKK